MQRPYQSRAVCIPARSQTTDDVLWLSPSPGCRISFGKKSKKSIKKVHVAKCFWRDFFTCGLCELVSCCTCKSHTTQSCCFLVWDQIMHFFCKKKTIFQDRWGSLKRATNFQGYRDQGRELFQGRLWPEWVPIKGYRMEVDIGIAPLRQVAAAPIKVPNRKLCKSYLRKGLEVAGEFEKKSKSLLYVSNITGKSIYLSVTLAQIW